MWTTLVAPVVGLIKFIGKEASSWSERRDKLSEVRLQAEIAEITAKTEIAAFKAKADIEWDLQWASQAENSWKDEYLLILWTIPMVMFMLSLFIPGMREGVLETINFVNDVNPYALEMYIGGWTIIFSAVYGNRAFSKMMLPKRVSEIAKAFQPYEDDVPEDAAKTAQENINKGLF